MQSPKKNANKGSPNSNTAVASVANKLPPPALDSHHLPIKTQAALNQRLVRYMAEICDENAQRVRTIRQYIKHLKEEVVDENEKKNALACLNSGFHYANQYLEFLEELQSTNPLLKTTLALLHKKKAFTEGYPPTIKSKPKPLKLMELQKDKEAFSGETRVRPFSYVRPPQSHLKPSETLLKLQDSLCFFDCGQIINYAAYKTMLDVLGDKDFDYFLSKVNFRISANINNKNDFITLFFNFQSIQKCEDLVAGRYYYFRNHPFYEYKDPYGSVAAWNVVCSDSTTGKDQFIGFGLPVPCSKEQIHQVMVNACNAPPYNERFFLPKHRKCIEQNVNRIRASHKKHYDLPKVVTMEEFNAHEATGLDYDVSGEISLEHLSRDNVSTKVQYFNEQIETGKWKKNSTTKI